MKKTLIPALTAIVLTTLAGCHSDIVCTPQLKQIKTRCFYFEPLKTEDPHVGEVLNNLIQKEFIRLRCQICDSNDATVFITGAAFLTQRSQANENLFGAAAASSQAIESVTITVKDATGQLLASASYDNVERFTAGKIGRQFGAALAARLK